MGMSVKHVDRVQSAAAIQQANVNVLSMMFESLLAELPDYDIAILRLEKFVPDTDEEVTG